MQAAFTFVSQRVRPEWIRGGGFSTETCIDAGTRHRDAMKRCNVQVYLRLTPAVVLETGNVLKKFRFCSLRLLCGMVYTESASSLSLTVRLE